MPITLLASGTTGQTSGGAESIIAAPNAAGEFQLQLDMNLMASGDVIELQAYKIAKTGGASRVMAYTMFSGAQPAAAQFAFSDWIANTLTDANAVQFGIKQLFGTTRAMPYAVLNRTDFSQSTGPVYLAASQLFIKKNTALAGFTFVMTDSTNHAPMAGLAVTATRSIDGAAFAAAANAVTGIGNGWYKIDLAATDLNGTTIALRFTAAAADDRNLTIVTQT